MPYIFFDHIGEDPPRGFNLVSMSGHEAISELFHFELVLETDKDADIDPKDLIGKDIGLRVDYFDPEDTLSDEETRFIHGIVNSFTISIASTGKGIRHYVAEIVPAMWFLTKRSNFQVFENQKTSDIIKSILSDYSINATIPAGKLTREHCIQYLETDYEFVTRLMADEGFVFYFEHSKDEHKLLVKDSGQYMNAGTVDKSMDVMKSWSSVSRFVSSKFEAGDYSYSAAAESLAEEKKSEIKGLDNAMHTQVKLAADVAGEGEKAILKKQAEMFSGREDASHEVIDASSYFHGICAGASFKLEGKDYLPKNSATEFVVIDASHRIASASRYENSFKCIPSSLPYWGKKPAPQPIVNGPMTAKVVESGGDEFGRVKVLFLYEGSKSEDTNSCWIRVAQVIGGTGYGAMFTPRIDEEVVVSFINGNPDRPIITGTLYNKSNKPHDDYIGETGKPTRNGFLTSFDGEKFNELYFEDKPGEELFYVRTDNNYERLVEANDTLTINKGERKITINEGDENETLKKGNKTTTLEQGSQKITLKDGDQETRLDSGDIKVESTTKNIKMTAGKNLEVDAVENVVLKASSNIEQDATSEIKITANSKIELSVGGNSMTMDMSGITLTVGGNSVEISQSGVTVKGIMVSVEGSAQAEVKAPMATVSGDGMLTIKGGVVMIN
ncbi:MAG: type VI secretion system tip protein TssI/VgrG [Gammaproteobacteria bacterium]|nr:type VI secretion system tip protein TssI/VgrG [Gammaproteobacteria bacterium]